MLEGWTGKLLGATKGAIAQHDTMIASAAWKAPTAWTADKFDILEYDLIFLPGGHDKGMQQYIESKKLHEQLVRYVGAMREANSKKSMGAICHGVQVLAASEESGSGKSVIHDFETTALPGMMEQGIFWATRAFLGDYYKTFGAGTPSVEEIVKSKLDDPAKQWKTSTSTGPFTHKDPKFNYISGRFPPDAQMLAQQTVAMVKKVAGTA